jgi:hypothetical protein
LSDVSSLDHLLHVHFDQQFPGIRGWVREADSEYSLGNNSFDKNHSGVDPCGEEEVVVLGVDYEEVSVFVLSMTASPLLAVHPLHLQMGEGLHRLWVWRLAIGELR